MRENPDTGGRVLPLTRFTDPIAAETWDACFRWRDGGVLHDATIEDTWSRVAATVAAPNGMMAPLRAYHYATAFSHLRLLPDERLLQHAGTRIAFEPTPSFFAALNLAAFVSTSPRGLPRFDRASFVGAAALAVRFLDDASLACDATPPSGLRIGLIGLADALRKLHIGYSDASACAQARDFAIALAEGCLRGSIELAEERGAQETLSLQPWRSREMPAPLLELASRHGVRHLAMTAIESHPKLARLADNTTDAIEPRMQPGAAEEIDGRNRKAREEIRAAMQSWIDSPIDGKTFGQAFTTANIADDAAGTTGPSI